MMMRFRKTVFALAAAAILSAPVAFAADGAHRGVVLEVINGGGYAYLNVEEGGERFWIAGPPAEVSVGQEVSFIEQVWMSNFASRALGRTFEKILFVSAIDSGSGQSGQIHSPGNDDSGLALPVSGGEEDLDEAAEEAEYEGDEEAEPLPADGVFTVEQLYYRADELAGQTVRVRGKVVKVSENIMGMTWVHIQDGSGTRGKNKIIFTSTGPAATVGSKVLAEGTLAIDRDFGYGYHYSVIVEESKFTEE